MSATYEQHVFGLELQDKFLGPLAKSAKLLEKNAVAWDKFEARVRGGGMDKAMAKVNGLIARYEKLEQVVRRIGGVRIGGGGGGGGGTRAARDPGAAAERAAERAAGRAAAAAAREEQRFSAYRIRLNNREVAEKERAARAAHREEERALASLKSQYGEQAGGFLGAAGKSGGFLGEIAKFGESGFASSLSAGLSIAKVGISAIVEVMKYGWEYGKLFVSSIVEAAKERGLLMTALEVQLGSREAAGKQLNKTLDIAQLTPASNQQMTDLTKRLYGAQFKGGRLDAARAAWADVQAFGGNSAAEKVAFWTSRVASRGTALTAGVSGFGKAGISERFIREEMAKELGAKVGYKGQYSDKIDAAVQAAISDKQVSSGIFETATQRAILRVLKQKELGAYAKKKGVESLAGVLSNVEEMIPTFLMRLDIDQFKGIQELKLFLERVLNFFKLGTDEGKVLARVIEDLTNALFGGLKNIREEDLKKFFYDAVKAAETLIQVVKDLWSTFDKLIHGGSLADVISGASDVFIGVGKMIGQGILAGMHQVLEDSNPMLRYSDTFTGGKGWSNLWDDTKGWVKKQGPFWGKSTEPPPPGDMSVDPSTWQSLPHYPYGGTVPGPRGQKRLVVAEGGEEFLGVGASRRGGSPGIEGGVHIEQLIIQCDESAMRKNFTEWLLESIEEEAEAAA